jgi:signal transduction histidine kinase
LTEQLTALAQADGADLSVTGTSRPLPPDAALALYRAAQEALSNAR